MSMQCFLATEKPLQKVMYNYKNILPTIRPDDMFYDCCIKFDEKLTDQEKITIGNIFQDFCCYAVRSEFKLEYEPRYRQVISENYAKNSLDELKWFKSFVKKKLLQQDIFMVINLWLGRDINFKAIKAKCIDINNWELSEQTPFIFDRGIIYQFKDNSEEAIKRRKQRTII